MLSPPPTTSQMEGYGEQASQEDAMATALGDILRVAAGMVWDGTNDVINVLHFRVGVLPSPNTTAALLEDLSGQLGSAYNDAAGILSTTLDADVITVYNVTQDLPVGITSWGEGFVGGTAVGEAMPPDDALVVLLDTGLKRRQGKIYLSCLTESRHSGGFWDGTARTSAATMVAGLISGYVPVNDGQYELQVYSRVDGEAYPISVVRAQAQVADMPSRKAGRGS